MWRSSCCQWFCDGAVPYRDDGAPVRNSDSTLRFEPIGRALLGLLSRCALERFLFHDLPRCSATIAARTTACGLSTVVRSAPVARSLAAPGDRPYSGLHLPRLRWRDAP